MDYESAAGQVFMKDQYNRLKNYTWTERGIELTITAIQKEIDSGKYEGYVDIGENYKQKSIEIQNIFGESFIHFNMYYNNHNRILRIIKI